MLPISVETDFLVAIGMLEIPEPIPLSVEELTFKCVIIRPEVSPLSMKDSLFEIAFINAALVLPTYYI